MRAISDQSGTLNLFFDLYRVMKAEHGLKGAGFFLADQRHFDAFLARHPGFPPAGVRLVKEWEIHAAAKARPVDPARLRELDARLGAPTLWDSLVADRRLYLGRKAPSARLRPRRSHREMLALALTTERLGGALRRVSPGGGLLHLRDPADPPGLAQCRKPVASPSSTCAPPGWRN